MNEYNTEVTSSLAPGLGRRIFLVDDNLVQLKLARIQLEYAGFVVETASDARVAEAALLSGREAPDAIVSDVVMDGMDGFDFCKRLRQHPAFRRIPIVLMSSTFDEEEDRVLARKLGASALVARSANQQACIEALVRSLAEGGAPALTSWTPELYSARMLHQLVKVSHGRSAAEERHTMLFEHANDAIAFATLDGVILDANAKWEEISGLPRERLRGRHVGDFAAQGHAQTNVDNYKAVSEARAARTSPTAIRRGDGSTIFLEFTTAKVQIDGAPIIMSIGRDVTSLVETSRKLEASERLYRSLVENVPDVIWSMSKDGKYKFFSPNVERLTGFSAEDLYVGRHGASLGRVHPDDLDRVVTAREGALLHGRPFDVECRWQHRDGHWIWLYIRGTQTAAGVDGTFSDITARKNLEEQLCQAQKIEAIGQLTAGVAHDFNNILAVVIMNATHLLRLLPKDDPAWQVARDVVDAGDRGTELTKQLLTYSRRRPFAPKKVDLNGLLDGMARMIKRTVGPEVHTEIHRGRALGYVHGDPTQLDQVVMNLVVNARDAMGARGTLRIETANVDVEDTSLGLSPGRYVRLSVSDTGCGMDGATRKRMFEPFFTTKEEGTGLGLATSYGIARSAGGSIAVDSEPGHGTTFHVYLPQTRESSSTLRRSSWPPADRVSAPAGV